MNKLAETIKIQNIIDMAFIFTAMTRVFEKDSANKITDKLDNFIGEFYKVNSKEEFDKKHEELCLWFTTNIKTAERKKDERVVKHSDYASWGQAAKVINVVLKVCVYYCNLPSAEISQRIMPWLDAAVDNAMMQELSKRYPDPALSNVSSIADVDNTKYIELKKLVNIDINESFNDGILPVQWDDIMWRTLNK